MATIPPPETIDWANISLWAAGAVTVVTSMAVAIVRGVRSAEAVVKTTPNPPAAIHKTDVYTTDSIALERLTTTISELISAVRSQIAATKETNRILQDGNVLMKDSLDERRSLKQAIDINTAATEKSATQLEELRPQLQQILFEMIRHK